MITRAHGFQVLLQRFFTHLRTENAVSPHTISAYRDTLRILLRFVAEQRGVPIDRIPGEAFSPDTILAFLQYLETKRLNTARSRNARLAAIRAFVRFAIGYASPDFASDAQRILAIPCKRINKPLLGFFNLDELKSFLAAADRSTWAGRRDCLLFSLLYNTGARISEALQLTPADIQHRVARLHGKGRKERDVPLWSQTLREIQKWCHENKIGSTQPIFSNRDGKPLSRRSAARRFALTLRKARKKYPALNRPNLSPHTLRHTAAMHLLQSGVPLEIIALWLGHEQVVTTHGYIEADLSMKNEILTRLQPTRWPRTPKRSFSNIMAFLEAL
ncbi:MAG: tyrosine-type recombinase/integrase [Terrimicrobiaceae bacterium]